MVKNQTFSPDYPDLGLIRDDRAQTARKNDFQEPRVVLHSFYAELVAELLLIKLVYNLNWEF